MPTKSVKSTEKITSIRDVPSQPAHTDSPAPHRGELDEFLFHEGTARHAYTYLGAHTEADVQGGEQVIFRVWAPHAKAVSVVGSFGDWEQGIPMTRATKNGIFMLTLDGDQVPDGSVYKYRITAADGLAVSRASGFVGRVMAPFMSGCYTLRDERMLRMLSQLADAEGIELEPSALAGMYGPVLMEKDEAFAAFRGLQNAVHLVWATGGSMVPREEMNKYYQAGKQL